MKTVVAIAPGLKLTRERVDAIRRSRLSIIAIANVYELVPDAEFLYAADGRWWDHHWPKVQGFTGRMLTCEAASVGKYGVDGLEYLEHVQNFKGVTPKKQVAGYSSGEHALHFLVNGGYNTVILEGFEYGAAGEGHYFGAHPKGVAAPSNWNLMVASLTKLSPYIAEKGVRVINCTETTALECFTKAPLNETLEKYARGMPKTRRTTRQGS